MTARTVQAIDPGTHTMPESSLRRYLEVKAHPCLDQESWREIVVIGEHDRSQGLSSKEKRDKRFNWQRPTATSVGSTLLLKCFPGIDYVNHYSLVASTHLLLTGRKRPVRVEPPDESRCQQAIDLDVDCSDSDVVVTGFGLEALAGYSDWNERATYAWKRCRLGHSVAAFVGFYHSIWGDIAGRVVQRCSELGARRIVYVGKLGCLDPSVRPNTHLASGDVSKINGRTVHWDDYFRGLDHPHLIRGTHIHSPSPLLESREWLRENEGATFVDPEIGNMAKAANETGTVFGYLHIISNNLAAGYADDLSNERCDVVLSRRSGLLGVVRSILESRNGVRS